MKERIAEFIRTQAYKPLTFAELAQALGISEKQYPQLQKTLEQMEANGEIVRTRTQRYGAPERMNLAVGRLQGHPKGFAFLIPEAPEAEDVFVGREALNGAWHGDRVIVRLSPPSRVGGRREGEVIRILERANHRVVGTFEAAKHGGYVTPDDRRLPEDIFIPKGATNGARTGEKVVVQIVTWPGPRRLAEGKVTERLGMKGDAGVDILSIIRSLDLPEAFPARVLREAEALPDKVTEEMIAQEGRRDLRNWTIVTIDGEDAKDLDDAISVERLPNGHWRLGVHIADVSYYVKEGSALDQEAYKRGTSVYLADRVVPMLPPRLSNGICSLNPGEDRLTLSCVMEINREGRVLKYEIFPSVIRTAARLSYPQVNAVLEGDQGRRAEIAPLVPMLEEARALMEVLRARRERRGALDFDLPEAKVELNEVGWPVAVHRVDRGVAERIIEEFMLVANETVAEHCHRLGVPFMYRVHGEPAPDRLAALRDFLRLFGYNLRLPAEGKVHPHLLQQVIKWSEGRPEENLINSVLLRSMKQAVYSEENLGHFGLAAEYYCHFTSPIRRYPDLVVHRVLRAILTGKLNNRLRRKWEAWMPEAARHASERERVAMEAERQTLDLKKAEFMSDKVGETFEGIISGVGQFGFFVQLPNTVEGLVHVSTLTDDYYHFHENAYALVGERTRRRFRLGDPVIVKLVRVDVEQRRLDFVLAPESPVVTMPPMESESRSRAARKAAAAVPALTWPEPEAPKEKPAKSRRRTRQTKAETTAVGKASTKAVRAVAKTAKKASSKAESKPASPLPEVRVDMWGVPLPQGRASRPRVETDPGVINPFSVAVPVMPARQQAAGSAATALRTRTRRTTRTRNRSRAVQAD
ncbi:MAG TPA: ribonuclease R [Symbiobacteriaceae bacterium]